MANNRERKLFVNLPIEKGTGTLKVASLIEDWEVLKKRIEFAFPVEESKVKFVKADESKFSEDLIELSRYLQAVSDWTKAILILSTAPGNIISEVIMGMPRDIGTGMIVALWDIDKFIVSLSSHKGNRESLGKICGALGTRTYIQLFSTLVALKVQNHSIPV
jgi:hypothetical protein